MTARRFVAGLAALPLSYGAAAEKRAYSIRKPPAGEVLLQAAAGEKALYSAERTPALAAAEALAILSKNVSFSPASCQPCITDATAGPVML